MTKRLKHAEPQVRDWNARAQAKAAGLKQYWTGNPCAHGHIDFRLTSNGMCMECARIKAAAYAKTDAGIATAKKSKAKAQASGKSAAASADWRRRNPDKNKAAQDRWHAANPHYVIEWQRENRRKNPESARAKKREQYAKDPKKFLDWRKQWEFNNPDKARAIRHRTNQRRKPKRNAHERTRKQADLNYRIACNLRSGLASAVRRGRRSGSAMRELGCSIDDFVRYISEQFKENMSWDNWGKIWELDHIRPLASFNLSDLLQLKIACHFTNLRPLSMAEHKAKNATEKHLRHNHI